MGKNLTDFLINPKEQLNLLDQKKSSKQLYTSRLKNRLALATTLNLNQASAGDEAAPVCVHRCDAVGFKGRDGGKAKNRFLSHDVYKTG